MPILRKDRYTHVNPVLPIVDSDGVKGGFRTKVTNFTELYALSPNFAQLKEYGTVVWVDSESSFYVLIDINNIGNSSGWSNSVIGGGAGITDTIQIVSSGGTYNDFSIEGNIIVFVNSDTSATVTGFNSETYKKIKVVNDSSFDLLLSNGDVGSLTANRISLSTTGATIDVGGSAELVHVNNKWVLTNVQASKYAPEFSDLSDDNVMLVGGAGRTSVLPTGELTYFNPLRTTAMTTNDLNLGYPNSFPGVAVICSNIDNGVMYVKVDDVNWLGVYFGDIPNALTFKADKSSVLTKDNTEVFTPSREYEPTTKKYVDDLVSSGTSVSLSATSFVVALSDGKTLGKYRNGDTVPSATTIQEQLIDIGREVINPSFIQPSFGVVFTEPQDREVGFVYTGATMVGTFNQGRIEGALDGNGVWVSEAYQNPRAGVADTYIFDGNPPQSGNTLMVGDKTIGIGSNVFSASVTFLDGPQPTNNVPANFGSPLSGDTLSATTSITGKFTNFFGVSTKEALTSDDVINLPIKTLATSQINTYNSVLSNGGEYIYYCYPSDYPDLDDVQVNGVIDQIGSVRLLESALNVINQFGIPKTYKIYRTNAIVGVFSDYQFKFI